MNMILGRLSSIFGIFSVLIFFACSTNTTKEEDLKSKSNIQDSTAPMKTHLDDSLEQYLSEITCPQCGHKKTEIMPTDVCVIRYNCENCNTTLHPKDGDCCVFCSYGNKVCPSMQ